MEASVRAEMLPMDHAPHGSCIQNASPSVPRSHAAAACALVRCRGAAQGARAGAGALNAPSYIFVLYISVLYLRTGQRNYMLGHPSEEPCWLAKVGAIQWRT